MHPPPSQMAHQSISLYQTISNTFGKVNRSNSSNSAASSNQAGSPSSSSSSSHMAARTLSQSSSSSAPPKPSALPRNLVFDYVRPEEVRAAHQLEVQGYPPEDAASYEKLIGRQRAAPHLFLGAYLPLPPPKVAGPLTVGGPSRRKMVAFVCGTAATALTLRSMSTHDSSADAHMVCIHSVCVSPDYQRKGLATRMLENYISRLKRAEDGKGPEGAKGKRGYETLALLAHEELTELYIKVGFKVQCVSHIQYGSGQWLEMRRSLSAPVTMPGAKTGDANALTRTFSSASSGGGDDRMVSSPTALTSPQFAFTAPERERGRSASASQTDSASGSASSAASASSRPATASEDATATQTPTQETDKSDLGTPSGDASATPTTAVTAKSAAPEKPETPPGMPSQASIMAALAAQSQPGKSPGVTYTSILGQALAGKTASEDAGMALEARLVDRETGTNLARLYCPMENCRCCILGKGAGEYTRKESGPLSNPALELPNSPAPPQGPAFPVQGASSGGTRLLTSVKGFWTVAGPLQFDNVGFSRDLKWTAPTPSSPSPTSEAKVQDKEARAREKREEKERRKEDKAREKERRKQQRQRGNSGSDESSRSDEDVSSLLAHLSLGLTPGEEVTVKYLLCPDCECGPLGFTVLPEEMQGGRLAAEVGEQVDQMKGGSLAAGSQRQVKKKPQLFYLAAERVRYRFDRN
ncbi:uncharacterized protein PFL1_00041 [Pseudozyma flocculosa PF-1]|uniref:N-acetyltransferase domain-containing protein n=1 Tax=Pseudozyma flocculosa TaxID=84751 RepID=A0A5C3ETT7_9BASI|nr:uncharacterized protein PFL1_00041 [Pseudozyma flocculosa PF-1]EPQ31842.1 hypothetical protein PFL1_00041 [Pseudozyma flocculosa PF-1]SPO35260.1 uncharacterized protein PSFLO_00731 [Pseudozyma flocculosa]